MKNKFKNLLHIFCFLTNTPIQIILYVLALPVTLMELYTCWFPNSIKGVSPLHSVSRAMPLGD